MYRYSEEGGIAQVLNPDGTPYRTYGKASETTALVGAALAKKLNKNQPPKTETPQRRPVESRNSTESR